MNGFRRTLLFIGFLAFPLLVSAQVQFEIPEPRVPQDEVGHLERLAKVRAAKNQEEVVLGANRSKGGGRPMPAKVRTMVARTFNEAPDSPFMQFLVQVTEKPSSRPKSPPVEEMEKAPVVRLIRGETGVSFPTVSAVKAAWDARRMSPQKIEEFLQSDQYQKLTAKLDERQEQILNYKPNAPELPSCPNDITRVIRLEDGKIVQKLGDKAPVHTDWLFIRSEPPSDIASAFGSQTNVHRFTTDAGDYISVAAVQQGMICLPYRVRVSATHAVHLLGKPALKNYDFDQKGEMSGLVSSRLEEYR